ncbi:MAG: GntR family transcriptional regulator [Chitinivibrionales bacterium]|nr:GntR family transcriptional regulator [Chitinivibrionales bacterium]
MSGPAQVTGEAMKTSRALHRAVQYLHAAVQGLPPGATALPPFRRMAAEAGVSLVTLSKAVGVLKREGLLTTNHRHGTRLAAAVAPTPLPGGKKWERIARRITADIAAGTYRPGSPLPSCTELARRYGVSTATVRKALSALCDRSVLTMRGRRFVTPERRRRNSPCTLLVFTRELYVHRVLETYDRRRQLLRALEAECARSGLRLRVVPYRFVDGDLYETPFDIRGEPGTGEGAPIGAVILSSGLEAIDLGGLVDRLCTDGVPVSMLDETGTIWGRFAGRRRSVRVFSLANSPSCGEDVGRCLLRYGHRSVAFLTPVGHAGWSRARLVGIRRVFAQAGCGHRVKAFERWGPEPQGESLEESYKVSDAVARLIEHGLDVRDSFEQRLAVALPQAKPAIRAALARDRFAESMRPLMTDALRSEGITAWVAATDAVAAECYRFLVRSGIRVPGELSLVGFDDSPDAYVQGVASYNFNLAAVARAMVDYVTAPNMFARSHPAGPIIEIAGFVSERASLGAV